MQKTYRNKFSTEDKHRAVRLILDFGHSFHSVAQEFSTCHRYISFWCGCYQAHGLSGLSLKTNFGYAGDFKLSVLQDMYSNCLSLQQVSIKHCITPSVILSWKRLYEQSGAGALYCSKSVGGTMKMKKKVDTTSVKNSDTSFDALQNEVLLLRAEKRKNYYNKHLKNLKKRWI